MKSMALPEAVPNRRLVGYTKLLKACGHGTGNTAKNKVEGVRGHKLQAMPGAAVDIQTKAEAENKYP